MNSLSHLYVSAHQDEMRRLAANERLAAATASSSRSFSLGGAIKNVWSLLSGPAERPGMNTFPTLTNYPFRG
ncbi:MAG TPA: hypothetical protein VN773_08905 [Verrucomicrobiae bacterium]|nr:hypothetical protein [Verrucomicrobiae bacterium]